MLAVYWFFIFIVLFMFSLAENDLLYERTVVSLLCKVCKFMLQNIPKIWNMIILKIASLTSRARCSLCLITADAVCQMQI